MAETLVVGAIVNSSIDVLMKKLTSPLVLNFFKRKKLDDGQLTKLKVTMRSVRKLLNDAESKQITDPDVKAWLDDLRDAVYEADDFFDGVAYEARRLELEAEAQPQICTGEVKNLLSSLNPCRKGMGKKIRQLETILQSLEGLVQQKDALGLMEGIGKNSWHPKIPTTSLLGDSNVYGRAGDKESIMNLLLSDTVNGKTVGVISIVGMGGAGKTTLAQLVYNDPSIQQLFDVKAWVCVSEEVDFVKIAKDILNEVSSGKLDTMTPNQLHCKLQECLSGKKFLLVLDDVWNDDRTAWDFLLKPLNSGLIQGSKIIVTTREERVATALSSVLIDLAASTHHLRELSTDDCWSVFARHAFDDGSSSSCEHLEEIGREIVRKCKGLPLAAKSIGSLLRSNTDVDEWVKILESNLWDLQDGTILPSLRLSYHYLPSHLKQCFAYCSLFPKDYEFQKEELVFLWMAEGFFEHNREVFEGNKCFEDLVSRSFFQPSFFISPCFIMHDLLHDLAKFMAGKFCFALENDNSNKPSNKVRHLSYGRTEFGNSDVFNGPRFLRSFLLIEGPYEENYDKRLLDSSKRFLDSLLSMEYSRVLFFPFNMGYLPKSIGRLKHLRYLNLQKMSIRRLPKSLCELYFLQTLILFRCTFLTELPANMMNLIELCHLDIMRTSLKRMPPQMGKLVKLQILTDFFVGNQTGSNIAELGKLQLLQGYLHIGNVQNVVNVEDATEANLKSRKLLKKLMLDWNEYGAIKREQPDNVSDNLVSQHVLRVLEGLQPHTNLRNLDIRGYWGTRFPKWVGDSSYSNLISLSLIGCKYCCTLPPLGQLASLEHLSIEGFDAITTVGPEFYGSCPSPFRSLKTLSFEYMQNWHAWLCGVDDGAFPILQRLSLLHCPNLTSRPNHLPLTTFLIRECKSNGISLSEFDGMETLEVHGTYTLDSAIKKFVSDNTTIERIYISDCDVEVLCGNEGILGAFTSLTFLEIRNCPNLKWLPQGMHSLFPCLEELSITNCPEIEEIPEGRFPSMLKSLVISNCMKLTANFGIQWDLQFLPSFTYLHIGVESFPERKLLPSTLTSLYISKIESLESLDHEKTLRHLTSLTKLEIWDWPHIQSISQEGLPSTLISLGIFRLANLQSLQLQHLTSLKKLEIESCPELESISDEWLPSTLTSLVLLDLDNLQSLGLQHLTSLANLKISLCPKLKSIPNLPCSLCGLCIYGCPLLEKRCRREKGKDWPKISHIPEIDIL